MHLHPHESASCPRCNGRILYGLKREATGWKVVLECGSDTGCARQFPSHWIALSDVDRFDDAYDRATALAERLSVRGY